MPDYRDLLIARLRREDPQWPLFRSAPLAEHCRSLLRWRLVLKTTTQRPDALRHLRRDLPRDLSAAARDTAAILAQRPELAAQIGMDGPGLLDLADRREDATQIAAVCGQLQRAAELARQYGAQSLADSNQRALDGLVAAYNDPRTPPAERSRLFDWLSEINTLAATTRRSRGPAKDAAPAPKEPS